MATIHKRAKEELEQLIIRQRDRAHAVVAKFDSVLGVVAQASSDAELGQRIRRLLASGLAHWREECTALHAWSGGNYLPRLWKHFRAHRAVLFRLVRTPPFSLRPTTRRFLPHYRPCSPVRDGRPTRWLSRSICHLRASDGASWSKLGAAAKP